MSPGLLLIATIANALSESAFTSAQRGSEMDPALTGDDTAGEAVHPL